MVDFSIPGMAPFRIKQARNSARRENPSDLYDLIRLVSGKTLLRVVLCAWCAARGALRVVLWAWCSARGWWICAWLMPCTWLVLCAGSLAPSRTPFILLPAVKKQEKHHKPHH